MAFYLQYLQDVHNHTSSYYVWYYILHGIKTVTFETESESILCGVIYVL